MKKLTLFTPLFMMIALSITLPERGLSAESPKIEKAALKRDFVKSDQTYIYLFDFDFVNALAQPLEIISVNVFDVNGRRVEQDWAIRGRNWDPRLMTHALSGNHPLAKIISKPRGTPLEQATVSPVGDRIEIKVTNRILLAGQGIRPSMYMLSSKNNYDSLILRVVYRVNGNLQEVSHTFTEISKKEISPPPGRACMFYAPNVTNVHGLIGHVGWAFRDSVGNKWVFGATENTKGQAWISPGKPADTQSWQDTGTWAQVLQTFGTGKHLNRGPNYYQSYHCINIKASYPDIAKKKADDGQKSGYDWSSDNCLTKSVDIFRTYGATNLPPAFRAGDTSFRNSRDPFTSLTTPVLPSAYFPFDLTFAGFEKAVTVR